MVTISIRPAAPDDLPEVRAICSDDPDDYVPGEFPEWLAEPGHYTFVVELDGRPAGVANAKMLSDWEAWGQGVRVHPALRRRGVGRAITAHWPAVMRERGARVAIIATHAENEPSIRMHEQGGFRTIAHTDVRLWDGQALVRPRGLPRVEAAEDADDLWGRVEASPVLRAHGYVARGLRHFHHLSRAEVERCVAEGRALVAGDAFACYLVRPTWGEEERIATMIAADGPADGLQAIALRLADRAGGWQRVSLDGRKGTAPVEAVTALGFVPLEDWGEMLIMEKDLR